MIERSTTETVDARDEGELIAEPSVERRSSPWWARGGAGWGSVLADLVALTKPRITALVITTTAAGLWLGGRSLGDRPGSQSAIATIVGTATVVAGANALNMFLERDTDALMERTRMRPLPTGRLPSEAALLVGLLCTLISLPLLTFAVNPLAGALAGIALLSYVLVYTPMKRRSPTALVVGAVPGAIPPLLGWAAATGNISGPGLSLFGLLFFWQIPHFLAIATFRRDDYARAGLKVLPNVRGERVTRHHIVAYTLVLLAVTSTLLPLAGPVFDGICIASGLGFLGFALRGLSKTAGDRWAKGLFAYSIVYLTVLLIALAIGA